MTLKIVLAQTNPVVGAVTTNFNSAVAQMLQARINFNADVIVFPELFITGYPPEDLLFRRDFLAEAAEAIQNLAEKITDFFVVIGFPELKNDKIHNSAAVLHQGKILTTYQKQKLPNYGVFDEQRYFEAGKEACIFKVKGQHLGLAICEDVWHQEIVEAMKQAGTDILLTLNASPFHRGKNFEREDIVCQHAKNSQLPIVYVNLVGGQDELVFDGASFVTNKCGEIVFRATEFEEQLSVVEFKKNEPLPQTCAFVYQGISSDYRALVLGIKDYVRKNGFKGALLGLSGGIDSALVFALAVDALGAENVEVVLLPSSYTQNMSNEDAILQAEKLGCRYHIVPIEPAVNAFNEMLHAVFANTEKDTTEENIQARCRGVVLMAMSNKQGKLLLTTGNKSEMSVGYATLYGDMAGGFAPIKDVPKLLVYELAHYRNKLSAVIPERVLTRAPSAELAPNQIDTDSLPPYEILDPILERYIELNQSVVEIIAAGFDEKDVTRAIGLVDKSEYKRRQSAPCVKISTKAFGRDRRYPMSSGFRGTKI